MSQIKLLHSGGNGVILAAPSSNPASDRTLTLPGDADGTILTSNSSTGKILQHVYVEKTDTTSQVNQSARTDISGMSATITPSATSSKILILCDLNIGMPQGGYHVNLHLMRGSTDIAEGTGASGSGFNYAVDVTASFRESGSGAGNPPISTSTLDSPNTTSATTYKWQWHVPNYSNVTIYLNRNFSQTNYPYNTWKSSRIILMEVGA